MTGMEIKELRKSLGFSQQELAQRLSCSVFSVSGWERGISSPSRSYAGLLNKLKANKEGKREITINPGETLTIKGP